MTFGSSLKKFFQNSYNTVKGVVGSIYKDVKGVFNFAGNQVNKVTNTYSSVAKSLPNVANNLITTGGNAISSISNALPYIAGIGVVGLIGYSYMNKSSRSLNYHSSGKRSAAEMTQNCHLQNCHLGSKTMRLA